MKINEKLAETFEGDLIISSKRTRNLREIIGGKTVINNNVKITTKENTSGKCHPCNGRKNTICCWQVKSATSFTSYKNKKTLNTFPNLTFKNKFLIYFMECVLWKLHYVGKSDAPLIIKTPS